MNTKTKVRIIKRNDMNLSIPKQVEGYIDGYSTRNNIPVAIVVVKSYLYVCELNDLEII